MTETQTTQTTRTTQTMPGPHESQSSQIRGLEVHLVEGAREATLVGRLDFKTAPGARSCLHDLLFENEGDLSLDLADCEIWDSTGLGVLVGLARKARRSNRSILFTNVPPRQRRLLMAGRISSGVVPEPRRMVG